MIQGILDLMKDNSRIELRGFDKTDRSVRTEWSRKINHILKHIRIENNTDGKNVDLNPNLGGEEVILPPS